MTNSTGRLPDDLQATLDAVTEHPRTLHGDTWSKLSGMHIAGNVLSMLKLDKQASLVRRLVRKTQDGTVGQKDDNMPEEDDTQVRVGDETHIHLPSQDAAKKPSALSKLLPLVLSGVLAGTGVTAPVWLPTLINWLTPPATQPVDPSLDPGGVTIEPIRDVQP